MTSLQKALKNGKGAFEASFKAGIDISELEAPEKQEKTSVSASAAGLDLVKQKAEWKRQQVQEERDLRQAQRNPKPKNKLEELLVEMHSSDVTVQESKHKTKAHKKQRSNKFKRKKR